MGHHEKPERIWLKNNKRTFDTYTARMDGGTLTAFYHPVDSTYHLSFFHNQKLGENSNGGYGGATYSKYGVFSFYGEAKKVLPELLKEAKSFPNFPSQLSDGLEKIIEQLNNAAE